ncbi:ATP-binding protein [Zhouia sp. PK063]|uniref:sensor histidine kinase n=1 Tax=Zhouia sp. PK063 TaxID=3373602 RepID=UPI00378B1646
MLQPALPSNEVERLRELKGLQVLDTLPDADFDNIVKIASQICGTPIALISLVDDKRQWFKASLGIDVKETPREEAFCSHSILNPDEPMEVFDARKDIRFKNNPHVKGNKPIIFYTGIPLKTQKGLAVGTLCVIDHQPKKLSDDQIDSLKALSTQVVRLFELRKKNRELEKASKEIKKRYNELERFAGVVSHDMKSPLGNISLTVDTLRLKLKDKLDETSINYLDYLKSSSLTLSNYINGILEYYKSDHTLSTDIEKIKVRSFVKKIVALLDTHENCDFELPPKGLTIHANRPALQQIILNLVANSIKYCDKENTCVKIKYDSCDENYIFSIADNGPGIAKEDQERIFELFTNLEKPDRKGKLGSGIGLATVKKLVDSQEGKIEIKSVLNEGTTFIIYIPKNYRLNVV